MISAGQRGLQLLISSEDLIAIVKAKTGKIVQQI